MLDLTHLLARALSMKSIKFSLLLATFGLFSAANAQPVGDFTLLDHQGKSHQLSWYGDHKALVISAQANASDVVRQNAQALQGLNQQLGDQEAVFFLLNSQVKDNRASIAAEAAKFDYQLPILVDEAQLVAESLGITRVGETLVINAATMEVVFRGPSDTPEFTHALQATIAGNPPTPTTLPLTGQEIAFPSRAQHNKSAISYTADIAPILKDNCVSCHHDGGIGPWSMNGHAMVRGWSPMMREVVMTRRMPPGQIDPHVGKPIAEVAGLTVAEQQKLVHWIDAGSPFDGERDPLVALTFDNPKFSLGKPDMVFKVPAQTIPATGIVDYRYVPVELNLDKDVWVSAMEFVPGDRQVLHHVIAYLSSPADKTVKGRDNGSARGDSVGGFAPGRQPDAFRDNSGRLIRKGSNLLLQMHYTTSGRETVDETEVGLFIHDKPPAYIMSGGVAGQRRFFIPAYSKEYKIQGEQLIERDAYLYDMTPHMHFRGKYMSYTAEYPDGSSEVLLSVPKYDFNWQFNYPLAEPLFLPAGTRLIAKGAMDNSERNPSNPDPSKPVHFGLQTKHEMFFGFTTLRYVGDTPASLVGDAIETDRPSNNTADVANNKKTEDIADL